MLNIIIRESFRNVLFVVVRSLHPASYGEAGLHQIYWVVFAPIHS